MSLFITIQMHKKFFVKTFFIIIIAPILFLSFPKKTEAFLGIGDVVIDPVDIVENTISATDETVSAASNVVEAETSIAQQVKTYLLDPLAYAFAKMIIKNITAQTVKWINSGFKGNPAFVTDPGQFFQNAGDTMAARALSSGGPITNALCSPWKAQVRLALVNNYLKNPAEMNKCTIDTVIKNYNNFQNDFSQGGWDGWFSMTQNQSNNPYGQYIQGRDSLSVQVGSNQGKYQNQLNQNKGFLSFERCKSSAASDSSGAASNQATLDNLYANGNTSDPQYLTKVNAAQLQVNLDKAQAAYLALFNNPSATPAQLNSANQAVRDAQAKLDEYQNRPDYVDPKVDGPIGAGSNDCAQKETVTPGSVIESSLAKVTNTSITQLELANSINQIVSALLQQMFKQVVGGQGTGGLLGLSQSSATNPRSLLQQISASSTESVAEGNALEASISNTNTTVLNQTTASMAPLTNKLNSPTLTFILSKDKINIQIFVGDNFDPMNPQAVIAADTDSGDITSLVTWDSQPALDTKTPGVYTITYSVTNTSGNSATPLSRTLTVLPAIVPPGFGF